MIELELTEQQFDELHREANKNPVERARRKCWVVYLRGRGITRKEVASIVRVDEDTVTEYVRKYVEGGLELLLSDDYRRPKGRLDEHTERLRKVFESQPPHTVNEAIEIIERETGVRLKNSGCRSFLGKLGMRCRRCGLVPGNAIGEDSKQRQAQEEFYTQELAPRVEESKQGARVLLFADAAHFVMGAFLGILWCFVRVLLPSSSGRKRYNVLGAYDPIKHQMISVTNSTVVNQETFCALLDKIGHAYGSSRLPITVVLDNARYQKCQSVFQKAAALGIELLYLPPYSPNLNLIERLWRFVKKQVLYSRHYETFATFTEAIDNCLVKITTHFQDAMKSLMTLNFQFFSKAENMTA